MKKLIFIFFAILASHVKAQNSHDVLVVKKINNGVVCDSCRVTMAGRLGSNLGRISFLTPNNFDQFLYQDSLLTAGKDSETESKFYLSVGEFSLDFYPYEKLGLDLNSKDRTMLDFKGLQFKTLVNNRPNGDWKNIPDLKKDPDFHFGMTDLNRLTEQAEITPSEHYYVGKFNLKMNESLMVVVRKAGSEKELLHFTIKRVRSVPDYFEYIQFPSTENFEEILNTQVNRRRTEQGSPGSNLEMEAGNSGFLRFANNEQYSFGQSPRNTGVEYAMGDRPDEWKDLGGGNLKFTNGFTYIYLENPKPGKKIEILLRYKYQRESIHKVTIQVKKDPSGTSWILTGVVLLIVEVLFHYTLKGRNQKRIAALNQKKNEIENNLQLLNGRLNPHFLFNSLNAVQGLIRQNDNDAANQYITEVAVFMRTIMDAGRKELVSLEEEISMEESYISLEQKRKTFVYKLENKCGIDLTLIEFPPLLLQPIIENSIRHGFANNISNPQLLITIDCNEKDLIVISSDNGIGYRTMVETTGHGLSLTRKRIDLLNEKHAPMRINMEILSEAGKGCATKITLQGWLA